MSLTNDEIVQIIELKAEIKNLTKQLADEKTTNDQLRESRSLNGAIAQISETLKGIETTLNRGVIIKCRERSK